MYDDYSRDGIKLLDSCNEQTHMHEECEVIMLLRGSGNANLNGRAEVLAPGSMLVVNPLEQHTLSVSENSNAIRVFIPYKYLSNSMPIYFKCLPSRENDENKPHYNSLRRVIARAILDSHENREYGVLLKNYYLYSILYELRRNFTFIRSGDKEAKSFSQEYLSYIYNHYKEDITPGSAAKRFYLSESYFSRVFTESIGMSFTRCVSYVRLENAKEDLAMTDYAISTIAEENGFSNLKSFSMAFKREYGVSPNQFRTSVGRKRVTGTEKNLVSVANDADLKELLGAFISETSLQEIAGITKVTEAIEISLSKKGTAMRQTWRNMLCVGKASDILNPDIMDQIRDMRQKMSFSTLHFHGLFDDDMRVYTENSQGEPELNFHFIDKIFDFLVSLGMKPFVEFTFMPGLLASDPDERIFLGGYHSKPISMRKWNYLIFSFIKHCVDRYKYSEVQSWKFQIWDSALYAIFWRGTSNEFYEFYHATYNAIKSAYPELSVGAPSVSIYGVKNTKWLDDFLQFTRENNCVPNFISLAVYPHDDYLAFRVNAETQMLETEPFAQRDVGNFIEGKPVLPVSLNSNYLRDGLCLVNSKLKAKGFDLPVYITQWNSTQVFSHPICDMVYQAAYILKNICENFDSAESFGYWIMSEAKEEYIAKDSPFHGSGALISNIGIKKPSYFAFDFLSRLRGTIVARGDGYFVARDGDDVFVLMYNYQHPSEEYCQTQINSKDYDDIFQSGFTKELRLDIKDFSKGSYKINCYLLNRENGSSYDNWLQLGAMSNLDEEDSNYLKLSSTPKRTLVNKAIDSMHTLNVLLQSNEIRLYEFIKNT